MGISYYGVTEQRTIADWADVHVEELEALGYTVVDGCLAADEIAALRHRLDGLLEIQTERAGGRAILERLGEANQVRAPLAFDEAFLSVATNRRVMLVTERMLGRYFILMQQNGIINVPTERGHQQGSFHRDLPYQHFVSTRPIAINALLCLDAFEAEVGSTVVVPASHKQESFPSEQYIDRHARSISAPAGSYVVMDAMLYHRAGRNRSDRLRRAVNNVYTLPFVKQQIVLPALLGGKWSDDPQLARFLGYDSDPPRNVDEFISVRKRKSGLR